MSQRFWLHITVVTPFLRLIAIVNQHGRLDNLTLCSHGFLPETFLHRCRSPVDVRLPLSLYMSCRSSCDDLLSDRFAALAFQPFTQKLAVLSVYCSAVRACCSTGVGISSLAWTSTAWRRWLTRPQWTFWRRRTGRWGWRFRHGQAQLYDTRGGRVYPLPPLPIAARSQFQPAPFAQLILSLPDNRLPFCG